MIIFYLPDELLVAHIVTMHTPDYKAAISAPDFAEHWIEVEGNHDIRGLQLVRGDDGEVRAILDGKPLAPIVKVKHMGIAAPSSRVPVGEEIVLTPVPPGAVIAVNGNVVDTMDESGCYEASLSHPGRYDFHITAEGYYPWGATVEAFS